MKFKLTKPNSFQKTAVLLTAVLARESGSAYWVGGAVRDILLGNSPKDIDISTAAKPVDIKKILRKMNLPVIAIGEKFGTIATIVEGSKIEITTYRAESDYSDSRHPDKVKFISNIKTDAARRDFTVNAFYWNPENGEVLDLARGKKDLETKSLRFVGNANQRIIEDPLRMLRAARFATILNLKINSAAKKAIIKNAALVKSVSSERILEELDKIMASPNYHSGILLLNTLGLLAELFPEIERLKNVKQSRNYHAEGNVFIHTMRVLSHAADGYKYKKNISVADESELSFRYAALFHDLGKWDTAHSYIRNKRKHISFPQHGPVGSEVFLQIAKRLKFPKKRTAFIAYLVSHHMDLRHPDNFTDSVFLSWIEKPFITELIRLRYADDHGGLRTNPAGKIIPTDFSELKRFEKKYLLMLKRFQQEFISGNDIIQLLGIKPGKKVGHILLEIRKMQALGEINSRKEALSVIKKMKKSKIS